MTGEARPRKAPRRFRFSLRTLLLASLLAGSAMLLHSQWAPWTKWTFVPEDAKGSSFAEFSSDGTRILTVHGSHLIRLWDARDFTEQVRLDIPDAKARLSPDGRWIVVFPDKGPVSVWDADTGKEQARLLTKDRFSVGALAPGGSWLLTASATEQALLQALMFPTWFIYPESSVSEKTFCAHLWDLRTGEEVLRFAEEEHVASVCFSPCGRWFLTTAIVDPPKPTATAGAAAGKKWTGTARIWNAATGRETVVLRALHLFDVHAAFFPDGDKVATVDGSQLRVFDTSNGDLLTQKEASGKVYVLVSPDGRRIVTTESFLARPTPTLLDASDLAVIATLEQKDAGLGRILSSWFHVGAAFSPDGQRIILHNGASVWSAEDGTELWNLGRPLIGVNPHSFDPEGCRIISGDENGAIHIWTRRRPERWWGVVCLPAFWVTLLACGAFGWSIRRDRKTL